MSGEPATPPGVSRLPLTAHRSLLRWTLLSDGAHPGWHNMAVDSALLDLAQAEGGAFLRLYRWDPFCLSFGRHEAAARRYDRGRIEALGLACVRRPTGGRAVWHARELTYAVAAPLAVFGGMRQAYQRIHLMLAGALRLLGAAAELAPSGVSPQPSGPCFSAPVGGEVLIAGRKVIGSAQLRQGDALLQHGSLLLEDDQALPRSLAGVTVGPGGPGEAPLSLLLGRPVSFEDAANAVTRAADASFGPWIPSDGLVARLTSQVELRAPRFRDPAWTWDR